MRDAEEVVQEAYVRALASLGEFRGEARLSTSWLARIVINEALRRLSRRRLTFDLCAIDEGAAAGHPHSPTVAPPPTPEQAAARAQIRRLLLKFVLYRLHKTIGITAFLLVPARLALHRRRGRPAWDAALPDWQRRAASAVHAA